MAGGKGGSREISYESTAMILMKMRCVDQDGRGGDGGRWSDSGCILQVEPSGLDEGWPMDWISEARERDT